MNKKLFKIMLVLTLTLALFGCSNGKTNKTENEKGPAPAIEEKETLQERGKGTFYLTNESGTTEGGKPILIYASKDDQLLQIGINTSDFDGSKLTYVYVDGELLTKEQYGETASTLDLNSKYLKEGMHQIVLKQYENDDEATEPVTVKTAEYEVKIK